MQATDRRSSAAAWRRRARRAARWGWARASEGVARGTQGYSRVSSTRYLKCAHGSTWGTQWDSGALTGRSTTHAPDGATVGTKVVGASVLFVGEGVGAGVGAGVNGGVGAGVTTVGAGENGTAQRWTARQIGRCEYPRSTPRVEPARRETSRAVLWTAPWYVQVCSRPTMYAHAHDHALVPLEQSSRAHAEPPQVVPLKYHLNA
jgi:hypothetical protein